MADPYSRAKLRLLGRVMHDGRLTATARLVFYEILDHVNRVSGDAWPSEQRIADRLGFDERTVRRALYGFVTKSKLGKPNVTTLGLVRRGYITVEADGRSNTYRPVFDSPALETPDDLSGAQCAVPSDKDAGNSGQHARQIPDRNGPLSLLSEPAQENLLKDVTLTSLPRSRAREGLPDKQKEQHPLLSRADDGGVHLMLIKELGSEVVEALHKQNGGRPLLMLTAQRRQRQLTPTEMQHARDLAAGELRKRGGRP